MELQNEPVWDSKSKDDRLAIEKGVIPFGPGWSNRGNPIQIKGLGEFDSLRLD